MFHGEWSKFSSALPRPEKFTIFMVSIWSVKFPEWSLFRYKPWKCQNTGKMAYYYRPCIACHTSYHEKHTCPFFIYFFIQPVTRVTAIVGVVSGTQSSITTGKKEWVARNQFTWALLTSSFARVIPDPRMCFYQPEMNHTSRHTAVWLIRLCGFGLAPFLTRRDSWRLLEFFERGNPGVLCHAGMGIWVHLLHRQWGNVTDQFN